MFIVLCVAYCIRPCHLTFWVSEELGEEPLPSGPLLHLDVGELLLLLLRLLAAPPGRPQVVAAVGQPADVREARRW